MVRHRQCQRRRLSPAAETPLDDEDLLREILLRLPPQPSSLPRASAVCTCWRHALLGDGFLRRFRAHHWKPALLGFFLQGLMKYPPSFVPALDPPNRIPATRFSGLRGFEVGFEFLGCRHGLALFLDWSRRVVLLWEPITSHERRFSFPMQLMQYKLSISFSLLPCSFVSFEYISSCTSNSGQRDTCFVKVDKNVTYFIGKAVVTHNSFSPEKTNKHISHLTFLNGFFFFWK